MLIAPVQIMPMGPFASYNCIAQVATSPGCNRELLHAKLPPKPPLLKGEQTSCTCNSGASGGSQQLLSSGGRGAADAAREVTQGPPQWLEGLFTSQLFHACPCHANVRKNECNFYCLSCTPGRGRGMCKYCLPDHKGCSGPVFQIRKYMYQTCVHVEDLQHRYDTSGVQAYCINGKRAVLIHPKVMAPGQQCPVFDNTCRGCEKPLRADCQYCSLRCKVDVQYGRAPRTPDAAPLAPAPQPPPSTAAPAPTSAPPSTAAADSDASGRSSYSQWTCSGRGKKRKCDHPLRSHMG